MVVDGSQLDGRFAPPRFRHSRVDSISFLIISCLAKNKQIHRLGMSDKFVLNFAEPAKEIGPIPLVENSRVKALYNLRYTTREALERAKTLDDVW